MIVFRQRDRRRESQHGGIASRARDAGAPAPQEGKYQHEQRAGAGVERPHGGRYADGRAIRVSKLRSDEGFRPQHCERAAEANEQERPVRGKTQATDHSDRSQPPAEVVPVPLTAALSSGRLKQCSVSG